MRRLIVLVGLVTGGCADLPPTPTATGGREVALRSVGSGEESSTEFATRLLARTEIPVSTSTSKGEAELEMLGNGTIESEVSIDNQGMEVVRFCHIHAINNPDRTGPVVWFLTPTGVQLQIADRHIEFRQNADYVNNAVFGPDTPANETTARAALLADPSTFYVNCHSNAFPPGFIRGNLPGDDEGDEDSDHDAEDSDVPDADAVARGRQIFRHESWGDERFWTDTLRMHEVIQAAVSPAVALAVGLKVDAERLPPGFLAGADLMSPATTVELLRRDAVIGLAAKVTDKGELRRVGITCALCHTMVDNSVAPGVGRRLDGWPNRDLNVGAIVALSPAIPEAVKTVLRSWGPGRYDAYFNQDGVSDPVLIPPAYGLRDVALETYTGEGPVSYWNNYVAVTQMHGQGSFSDPRLGIAIVAQPDRVTPKLPVLRDYQLTLEAPPPPRGSFDPAAAERGKAVFNGPARCASCHIPPTFTDAGLALHAPAETGMDPVRAGRGANDRYRTTPLRGAWHRAPYFHDGSAATLAAVVEHYAGALGLSLTAQQKADLVEYLKSL
jgi:hypothetical protein